MWRSYPAKCPTCLMKYPDIRGVVFSPGETGGHQCTDIWHMGPNYNPNILELTSQDRKFLKSQLISPD